MRLAGLVLATLLLLSCASVPQTPQSHEGQIHVYVENDSFERATVYLLYNEDGLSRKRMLACSGLSRCNYWISTSRTNFILNEGTITIGWRMDNGSERALGQWLHGNITIPIYYSSMTVVLKITTLTTWMYPGERDRKIT